VSTSFKRLQAEKIAADAVLRELTPIETIQDAGGLKDYLKNIGAKQEVRWACGSGWLAMGLCEH